jgi:cytochrome c2
MREEQIYVFDRNGIWRLVDRDLDGEADRHELFSNVFTQTAETREFANGIRAAPDGTFVIGKGGQQGSTTGRDNGMILRVASDGRAVTVLGRGLRQPFLGMHPATGLVTASDQQGHYIPTTALHVIEQGNYYGFLSLLLPKERYPAPIADPLVWIPHAINASGAGQVWLSDDRMGPLSQGLIHLGYYRPEIFAVLMHRRAGRLQAAVVSLTRDLDFPLLNGAVNPVDGQLYVTGFQVWGTTARDVSGLARFRFTGAPSAIPREVAAFDKGILLRFEHPLDSVTASNPQNFSAERWNYVRTANYGSPHLRLDGSKGQETLVPSSAYLSLDGKSVFIGIRDMRPVMQMRFGWTVKSAEGHSWQQSAYFTPKMLPKFEPAAEGFGATEVDLAPRATQAPATTPLTVAEGQRLAELMGCVACHSSDGSMLGKVGPSWKGVYGSVRRLAGGGQSRADEEYLRESIREPAAKIVSGFDKSDTGMPSYEGVITEGQIEALILYLKTLR